MWLASFAGSQGVGIGEVAAQVGGQGHLNWERRTQACSGEQYLSTSRLALVIFLDSDQPRMERPCAWICWDALVCCKCCLRCSKSILTFQSLPRRLASKWLCLRFVPDLVGSTGSFCTCLTFSGAWQGGSWSGFPPVVFRRSRAGLPPDVCPLKCQMEVVFLVAVGFNYEDCGLGWESPRLLLHQV